jgi:hypothetical protein
MPSVAFMKKTLLLCLAVALALALPLRAQQPEANPYDLLSRALMPIASVFSPEAQTHALSATLVLEEMTGLSPELAGMRVELALQPPTHLLIRFPYQNQVVTFCRAGESVWITPNTPPFDALANLPGEPSKKKKKNRSAGLGAMVLPFPPQQLALLPILFQVKDLGNDQGLRKIEARLMPELASSLGAEEWSAQLTLNAVGRPVRIRVEGPGWHLTVRVEALDYAAQLPDATWVPEGAALWLNPWQVHKGLETLGNLLESHRPVPSEERSK